MGKTSNEVKARYNAKAYDQIKVIVKKGEKDRIKAHAESLEMSLNAFIVAAIKEKMS